MTTKNSVEQRLDEIEDDANDCGHISDEEAKKKMWIMGITDPNEWEDPVPIFEKMDCPHCKSDATEGVYSIHFAPDEDGEVVYQKYARYDS